MGGKVNTSERYHDQPAKQAISEGGDRIELMGCSQLVGSRQKLPDVGGYADIGQRQTARKAELAGDADVHCIVLHCIRWCVR